jgi:hypothetical protein
MSNLYAVNAIEPVKINRFIQRISHENQVSEDFLAIEGRSGMNGGEFLIETSSSVTFAFLNAKDISDLFNPFFSKNKRLFSVGVGMTFVLFKKRTAVSI